MIPRLSGNKLATPTSKPLPSHTQIQKVFHQFFTLMERMNLADDDPAPETKQGISRKSRKKTKQQKGEKQP
jgi:hypothetical protein